MNYTQEQWIYAFVVTVACFYAINTVVCVFCLAIFPLQEKERVSMKMLSLCCAVLAATFCSITCDQMASAQCVPAADSRADVNQDGDVNAVDLAVIRNGANWEHPVECPTEQPDGPMVIEASPERTTVMLALPHKTYRISVPASQVISGRTLIGNRLGTAINVRQDTLILNCTIRNWQTGVGSGDPNVKVWIVNSTITGCTDYGAYLPGTGVAVIGTTIRNVGGTCLRLPHYSDAVVYDTTIESSARRLLLKAHNATRLGKPYSSGLWVEGCTFIGSDTQDYLVSVAPQNKSMTEDVRDATFFDCDFVFGQKTKIGLLLGGTGMVAERCSFDAKKGVPTRWAIVGERQGVSPYDTPLVVDCVSNGSELVR